MVGHFAPALEGVDDGGLAGDLVVAPEYMASVLEHILPAVGGPVLEGDRVSDIAVLNGVDPSENGLALTQIREEGLVSDFCVADDIAGHDAVEIGDMTACGGIFLVRVAQYVAIAGLDVKLAGMAEFCRILGDQGTAAFVLFSADGESDGFHCSMTS